MLARPLQDTECYHLPRLRRPACALHAQSGEAPTLRFRPGTRKVCHYTIISIKLAGQLLQVALQRLCVERPSLPADNYTTTVNKKSLRHGSYSIVNSSRAIRVHSTRVSNAIFLHKGQSITLRILVIDTKKDNPFRPQLLPFALQKRRFLLARSAPGSPEVEHNCLSLQVCKMNC